MAPPIAAPVVAGQSTTQIQKAVLISVQIFRGQKMPAKFDEKGMATMLEYGIRIRQTVKQETVGDRMKAILEVAAVVGRALVEQRISGHRAQLLVNQSPELGLILVPGHVLGPGQR